MLIRVGTTHGPGLEASPDSVPADLLLVDLARRGARAVRARATARGVAWDVDGLPPLGHGALRDLARGAGLQRLTAARGPWHDGAHDRQRLRVATASSAWRDHRAAARALGLVTFAGAWTDAGVVALRAAAALIEAEAAAAGLPGLAASDVHRADEVSAPVDVGAADRVLQVAARLARALGLTPDEVVVTGRLDGVTDDALVAAAGAPVRRRAPGAAARVVLRAVDRLGRAWPMGRVIAADHVTAHVLGPARAVALALEHLGGALPPWLAPEQVRVLPVGGADEAPARALAERLGAAGLRARVDAAGPLSSRVGAAAAARVSYLAFVGPEEAAADAVRARARGSSACASLPQAAFVTHVTAEVRARRPVPTSFGPGTGCAGSSDIDPTDGRPVEHQQRVQKERLPSANR